MAWIKQVAMNGNARHMAMDLAMELSMDLSMDLAMDLAAQEKNLNFINNRKEKNAQSARLFSSSPRKFISRGEKNAHL